MATLEIFAELNFSLFPFLFFFYYYLVFFLTP